MVSSQKPVGAEPIVGRRAVTRTVAHAAWALPAIQVAASVPAFAASGNDLQVVQAPTITRGTGSGGRTLYTVSNLYVLNDGPADLAGGLLTVSLIPNAVAVQNNSATTTGAFTSSTPGNGNPRSSAVFASTPGSNPVTQGASPGQLISGQFSFEVSTTIATVTVRVGASGYASGEITVTAP